MRIFQIKNLSSGFTLFELLLTVSAFAIIIAAAVPFSNSSIVRGNLDTTTRTVESALRKAYIYARAGENNSDWGVHIYNSQVIVFSGSTYNVNVVNEISDIAHTSFGGSLFSNGVIDIVFLKSSGLPNISNPDETITLTADNVTKTLTINSKGVVELTSS
ncbi:prepilin-type N-terminal cleavage/methylation domain-containing protein [Candidatus Nomurabacteria bacterium]|nr:prepilin-type N-terminal cleavage/methylation domain-containing protein [Candidatus Nomurabacteria bacterium]